jgi:hypothetical protein
MIDLFVNNKEAVEKKTQLLLQFAKEIESHKKEFKTIKSIKKTKNSDCKTNIFKTE